MGSEAPQTIDSDSLESSDSQIPSDAEPPKGSEPFDPLRLCIFTTIALLAWLLTPPLVVVWMSSLALIAYSKAHRAGLTRSKCYLRDVRLVLLYLSLAWLGGMIFTVREAINFFA